jgi:uncharacterized membrane protein YedE/YeeE
MASFTPLSAFLGGVMIGLAAVLLLLANGRIAGVSGILGGLFAWEPREVGWRLAFILGLIAGPWLLAAVLGGPPPVRVTSSPGLLVAGGLLVGYGTRLGSGCTSGHGVCGLARLSPRSLVATGLFLAAAAATVFVTRHVIGG